MSNHQDLGGSSPQKDNIDDVPPQIVQTINPGILGALREILENMKDVRKDIQDVRNQVQDVRDDMHRISNEVQDVRQDTGNAYREAHGVRHLVSEINRELADLRSGRQTSQNTEDQNDYPGWEYDDQNGHGEDLHESRSRDGFEDHAVPKSFDEPIAEGRGENVFAGDSSEGPRESSGETAADWDAWAVKEEMSDAPSEFNIRDPKNIKPLADHHLDEFRADMVQIAELATKFNKLPADAFSTMNEETKSLFVEITTVADQVRPKVADLAEFSHYSYTVVDTKEKVAEMVNTLAALPIEEPKIGVDLEGQNLGRDGPLYILIIHDYQAEHTYIVDVHSLQLEAFNTCGADEEKNLRWILESAETSKLIYDVRQDSEALYHQFGVRLDGILDVQLFKLAEMSHSFESPARYRTGLYKAISHSINMTWEVQNKWLHIKEVGKQLWDPDQGGSWDRFTEKNKCRAIIEYCLVDVVHLRTLYRKFSKGLSERWLARIKATTKESIEETWKDDYESSGAEGPWEQQYMDGW